jgi:hypothetical protein
MSDQEEDQCMDLAAAGADNTEAIEMPAFYRRH